jgi:hypothetical protein
LYDSIEEKVQKSNKKITDKNVASGQKSTNPHSLFIKIHKNLPQGISLTCIDLTTIKPHLDRT